MGSGCSSPLRRFGGKRGKPSRRESSPLVINGSEGDNQDQNASRQQPQQNAAQNLVLENEITIQSEINDDHPSSASYYTDGKNHNEETKISEHSVNLDLKCQGSTNTGTGSGSTLTGSVVARMMGINGSYVPHDRHLLVSPALSPAPSTCYSPSPAGSNLGNPALAMDLSDLNEMFKTLTFGLQFDQLNLKQRIRLPERQQSELHNYYTQQLVQTQNELIKYITVVFITADNFQFSSSTPASPRSQDYLNSTIETLANHIESNLRTYCDEHLFNLKFLNLSHPHLNEHFHINNLLDATMKILEQEYQANSKRIIVIILSNSANNVIANSNESIQFSTNTSSQILDKRQLPTKIEAQFMIKLQSSNNTDNDLNNAKNLLKKWYNQVGDIYYLNPIYLVYPKILNELKEERDEAWQNWLSDSIILLKSIEIAQEKDADIAAEVKLKSLFSSYIDFILREPALQKRTLLIRNYSPLINSNTSSGQQQQPVSLSQNKDGSINELAKLLADPNKLTLKRPLNDEEYIDAVNDWINENFNKIVESIVENQITHGKHVPPFIERNLYVELTSQRQHLEYYLDNITENFESKSQSFYNNQISPILSGILNSANSTLTNQESTSISDQLQSEQQLCTNHLVFISGPKGCGKSTLFAQIIKLTVQEFLNKVQIVYRFCGVTKDSLSSNRLLRSICEQFCQIQGENITAASYIYSARKEIMNALNKIIAQQTSIFFLDGLDVFKQSNEFDLDWLCEINSNQRFKVFIMLETDSDLYKKILSSYSDATYISLDNPSISEWAQMLTSTARSKRFSSLGSLYEEIKKDDAAGAKSTNLTYRDVGDVINMCKIRQLNNESTYPELTSKVIQNNLIGNLKNIHKVIISHLQYLITPYQLCALFVALDSSRNGLSETDIINLMTMISQLPKANTNTGFRFSSALLTYIKFHLQPWLMDIMCDNTIKMRVQKLFLTNIIEHYVADLYPQIIQEVREMMLDYFSRQNARSKCSKGSLITGKGDTNSSEFKDKICLSDHRWLAKQASEVVNLLILTNPTRAKDHVMNKHQFFSQFLYGSMPEEFIEDYDRLKDVVGKKVSSSEELHCLVEYIRQSIHPLRYDGSQIYSQIYCRAYDAIKGGKFSKSKKFNDILSISSCPPIRNLLPISEISVNSFIKTRIGQIQAVNSSNSNSSITNLQKGLRPSIYSNSNQQASNQMQLKQRIYTIKDNHRHVIVIYPDKGSISVWDIYEEKAVRTLNNLDQPRDLKMIDHKRAVILCNRELRVYDLDSGIMLTKLKGVMNQKMPFFEIFGENYAVALARNRMYVNMINLNTGELETTFKVGEDRFLNSLLVSANGGVCVCGDETQKPFPLLVWNLNERRLMYDLRLERHEFITKMSAISDDGHFVVSVCKQLSDTEAPSQGNNNSGGGAKKLLPNFIVVYDLNSGTLFKKWKPGIDSCSVAISVSTNRSGKVINSIVDSSILVWDLATGSKKHTLNGHSAPADVIKVQNNRLFSMDSTCRDQSLRIWDIEEGYCMAVFSPDAPVNSCHISILGDALVCGFAAEMRLSTLVLCKNETVNDIVKRNKRRKSSKSLYIFDEPPSRKSSS